MSVITGSRSGSPFPPDPVASSLASSTASRTTSLKGSSDDICHLLASLQTTPFPTPSDGGDEWEYEESWETTAAHTQAVVIESGAMLAVNETESVDENTGETMDGLVNISETPHPKASYEPLPEDLQEMIQRLCHDCEVEDAVWYQSPTNCEKIIIMGIGATKMQQELEKHFPNFKFKTIEIGPLHTTECREGAGAIEREEATSDESPTSWVHNAQATCDLILQGDEPNANSASERSGPLFAVTSAHLMLTKDQRGRILNQTDNSVAIEEMRREIESLKAKQRYILKPTVDNNNNSAFVINHPPLFSYRHYANGKVKCGADRCDLLPSAECCPHVFANDIAIFPLISEEIKKDIREHLGRYAHMCFDKILTECSEEVKKMMESSITIYVGQYAYQTVKTYHTKSNTEREVARRISFLGNKGIELEKGDSGSIVYIEGSKGERYAVGKLIRILSKGKYIFHQAILLSPALKDVEQDYPERVTHLRPFDGRLLGGYSREC